MPRSWIQARRLLAHSSVVGVVACSLAVQADREQCATNDECVRHGLGPSSVCVGKVCVERAVAGDAGDAGEAGDAATSADDPIWGCLGKVPPLPIIDKAAPVSFHMAFFGLLGGQPLVGLPLEACAALDLSCAQPLEGTSGKTDSTGAVDILVHSGFLGYLDVKPSAADPDLMPSLAYLQPVPDKDAPPPSSSVALLTKAEIEFLSGSVGKSVRPEFGHLFFAVVDCRRKPAANAIMRADTITADTFVYYTDGAGTPSITQQKTSQSGYGGYLNLPVGVVSVTLTRDDGVRIASTSAVVRAGTVTYLPIAPMP